MADVHDARGGQKVVVDHEVPTQSVEGVVRKQRGILDVVQVTRRQIQIGVQHQVLRLDQ